MMDNGPVVWASHNAVSGPPHRIASGKGCCRQESPPRPRSALSEWRVLQSEQVPDAQVNEMATTPLRWFQVVYYGKNARACPFNRGNRAIAPRHLPLANSKATTSLRATQ
jgi:hypothetical protein